MIAALLCPALCFGQTKTGAAKPGAAKGKAAGKGPILPKADPIPKEKLDKPNVTIQLRSAKEFFDDIKFIFDLAKSPKQYETLTQTLDLFLTGVDRTQVISIRGYVVGETLSYVVALPIKSQAELKKFLETASDIDVKNKPVKDQKNVYQLFNLVDGYLRYDEGLKVAIIGENLQDVLNIKTVPDVALMKQYDLAVHINNDAAGMPQRKKTYEKIRQEAAASIKKQPKEGEYGFKFRKMEIEQQLDELERFFVEAEHITLGWTTSVAKKMATLNIELKALPNTSLAQSVEILGKTPTAFGGIEKKGAVLTGSINFGVDEMRQKHIVDGAKIGKPLADEKVAANSKLTDDQRKSRAGIAYLFFDLAESVSKLKVFDGFVRVYPGKEGVYTTVGGFRTDESDKVVALLKEQVKRLGAERVKISADKEGDVEIHEIVAPDEQKLYPELIAKDGKCYLATSKTEMWYALGHDALPALKKAIGQAKEAKDPEAPVAEFYGHIGPFVSVIDRRLGEKRNEELSKIAKEVFKPLQNVLEGTETITLSIHRKEEQVNVHLQFDEDILRFAGKVMADFVKKALE